MQVGCEAAVSEVAVFGALTSASYSIVVDQQLRTAAYLGERTSMPMSVLGESEAVSSTAEDLLEISHK